MESTRPSPASEANFRMIDVGDKPDTHRKALASGVFFASPNTIRMIRERSLPKGDVIALSEIAGIMGAKKTSDLLPLCHPLPLNSVRVWHVFESDRIRVHCETKTTGKTGVEMEALSGVSAALLCLFDLTKGVDRELKLGEIQVDLKEGGKSDWNSHPKPWVDLKVAIVVLSDRCFRGEATDRSGPVAESAVLVRGGKVVSRTVIPDEPTELRKELDRLLANSDAQLVVLSGGTGVSPRDISPDVVESWVRDRNGRVIPGIGEVLRKEGASQTRMSWLSRSLGALVENRLFICLPGSPNAVQSGLDSLSSLIPHLIHISKGAHHESIR